MIGLKRKVNLKREVEVPRMGMRCNVLNRLVKDGIINKRTYKQRSKKEIEGALAWWLSWLEHHAIHQKVAVSIPGQGTYPGCRFDSQLGHI